MKTMFALLRDYYDRSLLQFPREVGQSETSVEQVVQETLRSKKAVECGVSNAVRAKIGGMNRSVTSFLETGSTVSESESIYGCT